MANKLIIQTLLPRKIKLTVLVVFVALIMHLLFNNGSTLFILILILIIAIQSLLSRIPFKIEVYEGKITFEYLQLFKKVSIYDLKLIMGKPRVKVTFRGGREEIIDIYSKDNNENKKLFSISQRIFENNEDYNAFAKIFDISLADVAKMKG